MNRILKDPRSGFIIRLCLLLEQSLRQRLIALAKRSAKLKKILEELNLVITGVDRHF